MDMESTVHAQWPGWESVRGYRQTGRAAAADTACQSNNKSFYIKVWNKVIDPQIEKSDGKISVNTSVDIKETSRITP